MSKKKHSVRRTYLVGVDEVGRGPIAGPVAVGAVIFLKTAIPLAMRPGTDSKKLSPALREEWFRKIKTARKNQLLDYAVSFVGSEIIDSEGLSFAIRKALKVSLRKILKISGASPDDCLVLLDGGLKAPPEFCCQKTIIRGDEKEPVISLASIVAKVLRDKKMVKANIDYPGYAFDVHKGYGTKAHYDALKLYNLSPIHRRSFL